MVSAVQSALQWLSDLLPGSRPGLRTGTHAAQFRDCIFCRHLVNGAGGAGQRGLGNPPLVRFPIKRSVGAGNRRTGQRDGLHAVVVLLLDHIDVGDLHAGLARLAALVVEEVRPTLQGGLAL